MTNNKVTLKDVYQLIKELREDIEDHYVSQSEFRPVKAVVYGMVGLILSGVAVALVAQVIVAFGL